MLDVTALAINDDEIVLALKRALNGTRELVTAKIVAPGVRHTVDGHLDVREQAQMCLREAAALGVGDHEARLNVRLVGYVHDRTTDGVTPIASATATYVTLGERRISRSHRLKSSVTMHAA